MKRKRDTRMDNLAQAETFRRVADGETGLINLFAADFRRIITEFERSHDGKAPPADGLLWIESEQPDSDLPEE